jgi:hypothetical protein
MTFVLTYSVCGNRYANNGNGSFCSNFDALASVGRIHSIVCDIKRNYLIKKNLSTAVTRQEHTFVTLKIAIHIRLYNARLLIFLCAYRSFIIDGISRPYPIFAENLHP